MLEMKKRTSAETLSYKGTLSGRPPLSLIHI